MQAAEQPFPGSPPGYIPPHLTTAWSRERTTPEDIPTRKSPVDAESAYMQVELSGRSVDAITGAERAGTSGRTGPSQGVRRPSRQARSSAHEEGSVRGSLVGRRSSTNILNGVSNGRASLGANRTSLTGGRSSGGAVRRLSKATTAFDQQSRRVSRLSLEQFFQSNAKARELHRRYLEILKNPMALPRYQEATQLVKALQFFEPDPLRVDRRFHEEPQLSTFHTVHTSYVSRAEAAGKVFTAQLIPRRSDPGTWDTSFNWPETTKEQLAAPPGSTDITELIRTRTATSNLIMRLGSSKSVVSTTSQGAALARKARELPLWEPGVMDVAERKKRAPALGPDATLLSLLPSGKSPLSMCFSGRANLHGSLTRPTGPPEWKLDEAFVARVKERLERTHAQGTTATHNPQQQQQRTPSHLLSPTGVGNEPAMPLGSITAGLASQLAAAVPPGGREGIFAKARRRLSNMTHGTASQYASEANLAGVSGLTVGEGEGFHEDPHGPMVARVKSASGPVLLPAKSLGAGEAAEAAGKGGAAAHHGPGAQPKLNEANSMINLPALDSTTSSGNAAPSTGSPKAAPSNFMASLAAARAAGMQAPPRGSPLGTAHGPLSRREQSRFATSVTTTAMGGPSPALGSRDPEVSQGPGTDGTATPGQKRGGMRRLSLLNNAQLAAAINAAVEGDGISSAVGRKPVALPSNGTTPAAGSQDSSGPAALLPGSSDALPRKSMGRRLSAMMGFGAGATAAASHPEAPSAVASAAAAHAASVGLSIGGTHMGSALGSSMGSEAQGSTDASLHGSKVGGKMRRMSALLFGGAASAATSAAATPDASELLVDPSKLSQPEHAQKKTRRISLLGPKGAAGTAGAHDSGLGSQIGTDGQKRANRRLSMQGIRTFFHKDDTARRTSNLAQAAIANELERIQQIEHLYKDVLDAWKRDLVSWDHVPLRLQDFKNLVELSTGQRSSKVYSAVHAFGPIKSMTVLKVVDIPMLDKKEIRLLGRYCEVCSRGLSLPGAIKFLGAFVDARHFFLIFEHCTRGDVMRYAMRKGGVLTEQEAVPTVLFPLLHYLRQLHHHGVVHRDIKPENLLLHAKGGLRIGGFGNAILADRERPQTPVGTIDFMAPEMLRAVRGAGRTVAFGEVPAQDADLISPVEEDDGIGEEEATLASHVRRSNPGMSLKETKGIAGWLVSKVLSNNQRASNTNLELPALKGGKRTSNVNEEFSPGRRGSVEEPDSAALANGKRNSLGFEGKRSSVAEDEGIVRKIKGRLAFMKSDVPPDQLPFAPTTSVTGAESPSPSARREVVRSTPLKKQKSFWRGGGATVVPEDVAGGGGGGGGAPAGTERKRKLFGGLFGRKDDRRDALVDLSPVDEYDFRVDIWSLGVTLFELLCGHTPFEVEDPVLAQALILFGEIDTWPSVLSIEARDFITRCLKKSPDERPSAADLMMHPLVLKHVLDSEGQFLHPNDITREVERTRGFEHMQKAHRRYLQRQGGLLDETVQRKRAWFRWTHVLCLGDPKGDPREASEGGQASLSLLGGTSAFSVSGKAISGKLVRPGEEAGEKKGGANPAPGHRRSLDVVAEGMPLATRRSMDMHRLNAIPGIDPAKVHVRRSIDLDPSAGVPSALPAPHVREPDLGTKGTPAPRPTALPNLIDLEDGPPEPLVPPTKAAPLGGASFNVAMANARGPVELVLSPGAGNGTAHASPLQLVDALAGAAPRTSNPQVLKLQIEPEAEPPRLSGVGNGPLSGLRDSALLNLERSSQAQLRL